MVMYVQKSKLITNSLLNVQPVVNPVVMMFIERIFNIDIIFVFHSIVHK